MYDATHARKNAEAGYRNIVEMVQGLTIEGAAALWADGKSREECAQLLTDAEVSFDQDGDETELREAVAEAIVNGDLEPKDFEFDEDAARERISEDPLSVEVRSGWTTPGETLEPAEFCILLTTGGPALRIVGDLDRGEPSRPRLEYQDWGTPWIEFTDTDPDILETYCRQFYFGE